MKISKVSLNHRKKTICLETRKGVLEYPFAKLDIRPTAKNKIKEIFVDPDLGNEGVTYFLESGRENSLHLDAFLEYNKDPDYLRMIFLFELTIRRIKRSRWTKCLICWLC
jgi:hypothetical protein